MKTYLARLDRLPPCICLMIARQNRRPIGQAELARRAGMSVDKLRRIGRLRSWESVTVGEADRLRIACGVTIAAERRHLWYIRRAMGTTGGFAHLKGLSYQTRRMIGQALREADGATATPAGEAT